jgi:hypothetical protein
VAAKAAESGQKEGNFKKNKSGLQKYFKILSKKTVLQAV